MQNDSYLVQPSAPSITSYPINSIPYLPYPVIPPCPKRTHSLDIQMFALLQPVKKMREQDQSQRSTNCLLLTLECPKSNQGWAIQPDVVDILPLTSLAFNGIQTRTHVHNEDAEGRKLWCLQQIRWFDFQRICTSTTKDHCLVAGTITKDYGIICKSYGFGFAKNSILSGGEHSVACWCFRAQHCFFSNCLLRAPSRC